MQKSQSGDGICLVSTSNLKDKEKIFTSALLPPLYLTAAYLLLLRVMVNALYAEQNSGVEAFKKVWWSGPIVFSILYGLVVIYGQKYMEDKKEFKITAYMLTYNTYQCLLNAWFVAAMIYEVYSNPWFKGVWGNPTQPGPAGFRVSFLIWIHYNNKFIELLDTVWMILRKKSDQISFLHCYHHVLLIWSWFLVCKIESGGDCYFGATVNSFVHVIMYGYYTMALLNIPCPWKKWITNIQMLQFCVCFSQSCYAVYKKNLPIVLPLAQAFVMVNMLVLFGRFYVEKYFQKKPLKKIE
jgi:elongation of very long chain fatty acids protein 4